MNMKGKHVPVNRLWVCVFATSLIVNIWYAYRMSKLRLWFLYHAALVGGTDCGSVHCRRI